MKVVLHMASGDRLRIEDGGKPVFMPDFLKDIEAGRWTTVYRWHGTGTLSVSKGLQSVVTPVRINGALVEYIEEVRERWTRGRSSRSWTR